MIDAHAHAGVLGDYLDALLQPVSLPHASTDDTAPWCLCKLGRLQLLLPAHALDAAMPAAAVALPPTDWHLARVHIGDGEWRVLELARTIAPGIPAGGIETLIPVTGSGWALGVPGHPQPRVLSADAMQWRPHRNSRPWLADMSRDGQFMALDVHILVAQAAATPGATMEEPMP